jgi:hypothetical protein
MFNKKPILQYDSVLDEHPNTVVPSKSVIPEWYKNIPTLGVKEQIGENEQTMLKKCMPFIDALSIGYMITLPYDLYVRNFENSPFLTWRDGIEHTPSWRSRVANENLVPADHFPMEYVWNACVSIKVPKGYSMIATHPFNRHDLPFTTLTGIVEGDFAMVPNGSFPFFIRKEFEGLIPQGTPIIQLIPFLQQSWESDKKDGLVEEGINNAKASRLVFSGWYKKKYWNRKDYT